MDENIAGDPCPLIKPPFKEVRAIARQMAARAVTYGRAEASGLIADTSRRQGGQVTVSKLFQWNK